MVKLEVIKELALKANLEMCGCGCGMPTKQSLKFAELIVRECIAAHADYYGGDIIGDVLKKHFGIKE